MLSVLFLPDLWEHPGLCGEVGKRADKASSTQAPTATHPQGETSSRNEPLTFALKNIELDKLEKHRKVILDLAQELPENERKEFERVLDELEHASRLISRS
jgi:hypothetical protein